MHFIVKSVNSYQKTFFSFVRVIEVFVQFFGLFGFLGCVLWLGCFLGLVGFQFLNANRFDLAPNYDKYRVVSFLA